MGKRLQGSGLKGRRWRHLGSMGPCTTRPSALSDNSSLVLPISYAADSPQYETSQLYCADAFRGKEAGLLGRPW